MLRRFLSSREGSVALIVPAAVVAMTIGIATATDIATLVKTRNQLQSIADAASLRGAQAANNALVSAGTNASDAIAQQTAQTTSTAAVTANAGIAGISPIPTTTVNYTAATQYSGSVTVTLTSTPNLFLLSFVPSLAAPLTVTSTSSMTASNTYLQVIFLVDISNSMAVGGTSSAITYLENSSNQCAFACHDSNGYYGISRACSMTPVFSGSKPPCDVRAAAKTAGINLKIDYVTEAIEAFMSQIKDFAADNPGYISIGINTFGTNFKQLLAPTTDIAAAITASSSVDVEDATQYFNVYNNPNRGSLDYADYNGGYTKMTSALTQLTSQITNVGDGSTPTTMKTYVIFISDGAEDVYDATYSPYYHNVDVSYTTACTTLKNKGVQLFSIWVPYYSVPGNVLFDTYISPYTGTGSGTMQGSMQDCASSSTDYFQADDGLAIVSAFSSALNVIINDSSLRISK
ncbi:TadE/TadG family type IV pilus assembly protein [Acetobacter conturbans]|uniref:VWFA domain-containing protein n=1 Tax=Acetobacter conturbans TaxID=1737472 RepID=A0ABX0JVH7_9PROT|nr:TadE/TadG family type IV pilus assembly protein [Acetobacter conturbans]NHN87392.1 hypothetical protein [Acetobacter conturbans]